VEEKRRRSPMLRLPRAGLDEREQFGLARR
jgi:hypothetical protein